jgi:site-specific DNA-cytosine methylase
MCFGFPCQSFSIAGNKKGFSDDRGQLFFEALRILKNVKPRFFIAENVASMSQTAKKEISKHLFNIPATLINSASLTAQNRKRLYWVSKRVDYCNECSKISELANTNLIINNNDTNAKSGILGKTQDERKRAVETES